MIFLGQASNYSARRIVSHLFAYGTSRDSDTLKATLAKRYRALPENVALYHSGRSALSVAFSAILLPGSPVILPGLTCIAVVRAIKNAGCVPVFVDIDPQTLQYDFTALEQKLHELSQNPPKNAPSIDKNDDVCYNGSIVAQNTLGLPLDMSRLEDLAQRYDFAIIEDLAHCAGRFYADEREVGTVGVAAALSFGKGKAIDTVCGGAVVLRGKRPDFTLVQPQTKPRLATRLRDRWYPVFGGIVRACWPIGLGKPLLGILVRLRWIEKSADTELNTHRRLTHWQAKLASRQLSNLPREPLRKHYLVKQRDEVLQKLAEQGFWLTEIWYDTPVSPVRYASEADFPNLECPHTLALAQQMINLPTWYPEEKLAPAHRIIQEYLIDDDQTINRSIKNEVKNDTTD